jgi:O-antigen ligase
MDVPKKLQSKLIFLFLVIFPFGHLIRIDFNILGRYIPFHPLDAVVGLTLPWLLVVKNKPKILKAIAAFLTLATFSYFFSVFFFGATAKGLLYLIRLLAYSSFFLFIWDYVKGSKKRKRQIFDGLLIAIVAIAIFGWLQYFFYPDFRAFTVYECDDHLYRMVGTFFDPGFTSIFFVFGIMASVVQYLEFKEKKWMFFGLFLVTSLLFTYSRAGYLAFFAGLLALAAIKKYLRAVLFSILLFIVVITLLPRPGGEGVRLERTASVYARLKNYSETVEIIKKSPVIGVGYNNICAAREVILGKADYDSHACYGADSSLLFLLATTGVVGFSTYIYLLIKMAKSVSTNIYGQTFLASGTALLFHSIFVNSLFYAWVMGWMLSLLAVSIKKNN